MSKINTFLAVIGMVFLAFSANAQVSYTLVPSDPDPDLGETITFDVAVDANFQDIASFQFSINWDQDELTYQGVSNFGLPSFSAGNFGTTQTNLGRLTASWPDPFGGTQSIDMDSVIFTIEFLVVSNDGITTDVAFSGTPLSQEIVQEVNGNLEDVTPGTIFTNSTIDIAGGSNPGGGDTCTFTGFGLTVSSDSAATGDPLCLDVISCNFDEIVSMQYTTQFDPTILQFDNVQNFNVENLSAGNFGTTNVGNGFITMSWFDTLGVGISIPDETVLYSICFTAIGAGGEMDTVQINDALSSIEVTDANSGGNNIGLESTSGNVLITGNSGSAVTVLASCETGIPGDTVTVDITVRNFDSIAAMQFSLLWDPAIIDFLDTEWTGELAGFPTFNTSSALTDNGQLTFLWDHPDGNASNLENDTTIFKIRYIINGDVADVTAVSFEDTPTSIETTQVVDGNLTVVPLARTQGKVEVLGEGVLTVFVESGSGCQGDTLCIPVTVDNFNEIASMQYDFSWDDTELDYIRTEGHNAALPGLNNGDFNTFGTNRVRLSWVEPLLNTVTLAADNDTLYYLCFEILGGDGTVADVIFDPNQPIEFVGGPSIDPITVFTVNDGTITTDCSMTAPMEVSDTTITNVLCNGDATGAIALTLANASGNVTFNWSTGATTQNILGLTAGSYSVTIVDDVTTLTETYSVSQPTSALSVTMSSADVSVNGGNDGTATATPAGGTPNYSYAWSNGGTTATITGLAFGTYTVTITDMNGCTLVDQVSVNEPGSVTALASGTDVGCNGGNDGTATVTPGGGVPGYTYMWSNGGTTQTITELVAGTYTVTVEDSNGGTATATATVGQPANPLSVTMSSTDVSVNGGNDGTASAAPAGGTPTYSYAWSNGGTTATITGLTFGIYTVTITDMNGCTLIDQVSVNEPGSVTAAATGTDVTCNGENDGTATVSPGGGIPGYTYMWSNGGTTQTIGGLAPGTYTVTVEDTNGATATAMVSIAQPDVLTAAITPTNVSCNGLDNGQAIANPGGGTPGYSYVWSTGATTQTISSLALGTYTVTITDNNSCTITASISISEPDAVTADITASTNVLCNNNNDGSATVTPGGGSGGGYSFAWSNGGTSATINGLTAGTYTVTVTDSDDCTATAAVTITEPSAVSVSVTSTNVTCNGLGNGTATVVPSGGTAGYTFAWSTGAITATITDLTAGTYTVTVTDANDCTGTESVTITESSIVTAPVSSTNITCNGDADGTATVTPGGGSPGYNVVWSNGSTATTISNLGPGTYTVTATDANGCTAQGTTTITEPIELTVTGNVTNETANNAEDGSIDITPAGGTPSYSYVWSNGATTQDISSLTPGAYTVTITDANGCMVVQSFTVNSFDAPQITVESITDVDCNGDNTGAIDISVAGGVNPYSYAWTGGATTQDVSSLTAGNYTVTVTDNQGTSAVETITVNEATAISITLDDQTNVACNGGNTGAISISVVGGTPGYTYNWGGGITVEDPAGLDVGSYTVTVMDSEGCTATGPTVTITEPTSISVSLVGSTNVICNGESTGSIDISVTGGTPVYGYNWSNGSNVQDPSGLPAGTYTVTVTDNLGCTEVGPAITISEPAPLLASSSSTNVTCNGEDDGTISVVVTGGVPTLSYDWNNGLPDQASHIDVPAGTYFVTVTDIAGCSVIEGPISITEPAPLTLSNTAITASASNDDGSIDLVVNGGTPTYSFTWNNGATTEDLSGLSSGCYAVTVEDANGCVVVDSIKLGGIIVISAEVSDVSCAGLCDGAIDLNIQGGIAPFIYSWSGPGVVGNAEDQSDLCAGAYSVTVTDQNNTQAIQSFVIGTPTALTVANSDVQDETGNGCNGSIDITITGGTLPYTYQWSNGMTSEDVDDLCKGDYSVTVVDANGCVLISDEFTVLPPPLVVSMSDMTMASCNGEDNGEACLSVLGGCGPYTITLGSEIQISVSGEDVCFDGLTAGAYTINVVDAGNPQMSTSQNFTITEPEAIAISDVIIHNTDPTGSNCDGAIDISVTGGTAPYNYQWSNGEISEDITGLCNGAVSYSVTVTDANGCIQSVGGFIIELGLNVQVNTTENVSCKDDCDGSIDISVTGGEAPYSYNWSNGESSQDLSGLCAGNYNVTVTDADGISVSQLGITIEEPSTALSVSEESITNPTGDLANGSISLNINGGWGNYQVSWSNGATGNPIGGLTEGSYTATVVDANGCVEVISVVLVAFRIELSFDAIMPSCNGDADGQVEVIIGGSGSGDYSIVWDNAQAGDLAFDLTSGTYCVTVTDNVVAGLSETACFDLGEPDVLTADPIVTNSSGPANGSIEANVSGGTAPYQYLWSTDGGEITPTVDNLSGGRSYGLVVTDANGCSLVISEIFVDVVGECLEAMKVITPNGDGVNDEFVISCVEGLNNNLKIFNRWGQMVYEVDNYDSSWQGTEQGTNTILPESGYFWVLEYEEDGQTKQLKGAFTLLRGTN